MIKARLNYPKIEINDVLPQIPHFDGFCSLEKLNRLVDELRGDSRFKVRVAGSSVNGLPIHHVQFGTGGVRVLILGFPHPMEPVGGMTVFALITLLKEGNPALLGADVEWNIVTCADPDGTLLNEAWSQNFSIDQFFGNYYMPPMRDQASMSFPIEHKRLKWQSPSKEARVLIDLLNSIKPHFYFTLHNTRAGGLFIGLSRDIDHKYHGQIHALMRDLNFPIQKRAPYKEVCTAYGDGISELVYVKKFYDYIEQFTPEPEKNRIFQDGANEWDYLAEIDPSALCMIAEMGCVRHPYDESEDPTEFNLREMKLQLDANTKYLASVMVDQWNMVKTYLDDSSPFYRAVTGYVLPPMARVAEGGWPLSRYPTAEILGDPRNNRSASKAEVFNACVMEGGLYYVQYASPFVRLLKASQQTREVQDAISNTEIAFGAARKLISHYIDIAAFELFDYNTLVRAQLGSGLIGLNAVIEERLQ